MPNDFPSEMAPGAMLQVMRAKAPLVQCITNYVAMNIPANVLLAAGASPAMVHAQEEAGEFAALAGALTINIGTLSTDWLNGMRLAAHAANNARRPWVLDPVAHYATAFRRQAVAELLDLKPSILRGNASEVLALAGSSSAGRGVDSGDPVEKAQAAAIDLARRHKMVVAVTGASDFVTDGGKSVHIEGGSPLMPRVTALGCSLTCLIGAFVAVSPTEIFSATAAALTVFAVAGERAAKKADGPGSFAWMFLDSLKNLDPETLDGEARIRPA